MARPTATRNISSDSATIPGLTHQDSLESIKSPITPSMEVSKNLIASPAHRSSFDQPLSAPPTTTVFKTEHTNTSEPVLPPKNLPFLQHDPYADDDVIQFDKNKEIKPSRSGSVRSIMSTSSVQSLKRGLSSLKRKLTTRGSRKGRPRPDRSQTAPEADGLRPPPRVGTLLTGAHTFRGPQRVETFQVASMAY